MQTLKLADDLFTPLVRGTKLTTLRNGRRDVALGPLRFEGATDDALTQDVDVETVIHTTLSNVPSTILRDDGFRDAGDALVTLLRFYPNITLESEVTAISYRLPE